MPPGGNAFLPGHPQPELHLARVAVTAPDRAGEVEDQVPHLRREEVVAVEEVENLDDRLDRHGRERELLRHPQVERGELVVLPAEVPRRGGQATPGGVARDASVGGARGVGATRRNRLRLRRAVRVPRVDVDVPRRLPQEPGVEAVALVAVGVPVLRVEVGDARVAKREGITLVVVVGAVLGVRVVGLERVAVGESSCSDRLSSRSNGSGPSRMTVQSVPIPFVPPGPRPVDHACTVGLVPRSGSLLLRSA